MAILHGNNTLKMIGFYQKLIAEIHKMKNPPRTMFVGDGVGALLSAVLLGLILPRFTAFFGIPTDILYMLAIIPLFFCFFDFYAFHTSSKYPALKLRIIGVANLCYCVLSVLLAINHLDEIRFFGCFYLVSEIFLVIFIASLELKYASVIDAA